MRLRRSYHQTDNSSLNVAYKWIIQILVAWFGGIKQTQLLIIDGSLRHHTRRARHIRGIEQPTLDRQNHYVGSAADLKRYIYGSAGKYSPLGYALPRGSSL